jgi:hypothetical protein
MDKGLRGKIKNSTFGFGLSRLGTLTLHTIASAPAGQFIGSLINYKGMVLRSVGTFCAPITKRKN